MRDLLFEVKKYFENIAYFEVKQVRRTKFMADTVDTQFDSNEERPVHPVIPNKDWILGIYEL